MSDHEERPRAELLRPLIRRALADLAGAVEGLGEGLGEGVVRAMPAAFGRRA